MAFEAFREMGAKDRGQSPTRRAEPLAFAQVGLEGIEDLGASGEAKPAARPATDRMCRGSCISAASNHLINLRTTWCCSEHLLKLAL